MIKFILYVPLIALIILDIYLIIKVFEYFYCAAIRHQAPLVSSTKPLKQSVIKEIKTNYPDAKNICEIGSGFGGLARTAARNTNATVYALENMPFSAFISKCFDKLTFCKNNKTIWCDAFKYLENTNITFDIAIAFLGPVGTPMISKHKTKIKVLLSLDFEIKELTPKRIIDIGHGYTIYNKIKYPHRLFVYEF